MKANHRSSLDDSAGAGPHLRLRSWRFLDLFRDATSPLLMRAGIATAVAWVPLAILSAFQGMPGFLSFLTDYAALSRFLIIIPVLILGERPLDARYALVAHHFERSLVADSQRSGFQWQWESYEKLKNAPAVKVILLLATYAVAVWLSGFLRPEGSEFVGWWKGGGGFRFFSLAGTWALFISYPILVYLTLLWIWRQIIWARFLRSTTRLDLRLIAVHPDHLGGLGFLEASLLGQLPFSFCLGVGLAGAIANRVFHEGQKVFAYRFLAPVLIAAALLITVAPYFLYTPTLIQMRRRGMLKYGALARAVGEQFEQKWLDREDGLNEEVLGTSDFASTRNLYGVVDYIDEIRVVPVAAINVYLFVIAALIPCIPVVIAAIPFNVLMKVVMKLLV
ncbi:MAG TPA: hypothetical protein VHS13_01105 [Edaphobacter sp.]|nr:hypothetical protein [Edaphobacter sp.]